MSKMNTFKNSLLNVYTEMTKKCALYHHDDKRFITLITTIMVLWDHSVITIYGRDQQVNIQLKLNAIDSVNFKLNGDDDLAEDINSFCNYLSEIS